MPIDWSRCPESVRSIEMRLYEVSRLYWIQRKRVQSYKNFYAKVCREQGFPCELTPEIVRAAEMGKEKLEELMEPLVRRHPVYQQYLRYLPGLGTVLSGLVLGNIHPWRFQTVSKLWAWCGWAPREYYVEKCGSAECYHRICKAVTGQIARQLVRNVRFYRSLFEEWLEREIRKLVPQKLGRYLGTAVDAIDGDRVGAVAAAARSRDVDGFAEALKSLGVSVTRSRARELMSSIVSHATLRAYRLVAKVWLSQYYEAYCAILGLPYRPPYVVFAGIRNMYYPPIIVVARGREVPLAIERRAEATQAL